MLRSLLVITLTGLFVHPAAAQETRPFLSPMFTDNMVLQRGMPDPVWGWTQPGQRVTVRIAGKSATATADADGKWLARVGPLSAGGPYTLTVSGLETVTLNNVMVGEVWVCSGQSNMEMGIGNVNYAQREIAEANYPNIRLYTVTKTIALAPRSTTEGQWLVCTPQTVSTGGWGGFSAVAYFFGRDLYQQLHVPIGLIHTSWGGTPAEAWTSQDALAKMADFGPALAQIDAMRASSDRSADAFQRQTAAWYERNDPGSAGSTWAVADLDTTGWKTMRLPTAWEDAGLPDFDGVVWFRKEVDLPESAAGKPAVLHLGPIDDRDTTYVNGRPVGGLELYSAPRNYRLPAGALHPGRNVIAVRVLDTGGAGGLNGRADQMSLEIPGQSPISLAGDWQYRVGVDLKQATPVPVQVTNNPNLPTVLYNGMIAPVLPYGIKGAIWYQGESNAGRAYQYRTLLPTMIADWRSRWGEGDFPFFIVQLADFMAMNDQPQDQGWQQLREAQLLTSQHVPNTALALSIDIGDAADIHPKNKQEVGRRLALDALAIGYRKKNVEYSGPAYRSMKKEGNAIRLTFDHADGGLVWKQTLQAPSGELIQMSAADAAAREKLDSAALRSNGFAIAGPDHHFVWADSRIEGNTVVVSSPQVSNPVAVRYAWANNPVANLYNKSGLPASPFRTDDWTGLTANNH